jgi:hypothetical protein
MLMISITLWSPVHRAIPRILSRLVRYDLIFMITMTLRCLSSFVFTLDAHDRDDRPVHPIVRILLSSTCYCRPSSWCFPFSYNSILLPWCNTPSSFTSRSVIFSRSHSDARYSTLFIISFILSIDSLYSIEDTISLFLTLRPIQYLIWYSIPLVDTSTRHGETNNTKSDIFWRIKLLRISINRSDIFIPNPRSSCFRDSSIRFTVYNIRIQCLNVRIYHFHLNYLNSPLFLQKSCIVLYNSCFSLFAYRQTLSKIYEKCYFHDFSSISGISAIRFRWFLFWSIGFLTHLKITSFIDQYVGSYLYQSLLLDTI